MKILFRALTLPLILLLCVSFFTLSSKPNNLPEMTNENDNVALIDKISIPKSSIEELSKQTAPLELFLKTMPGLIRQERFEQTDPQGNLTRITIAVWQNSAALAKARESVQAKFYQSGVNLPELMQRLNVKMERGIFNVK